jgi:hypothetical protein
MAGKGIDARRETNVSRARSPAKAAGTIRDPCWQRPDLTWEHSLGLSTDARGRAMCVMRTFGIPRHSSGSPADGSVGALSCGESAVIACGARTAFTGYYLWDYFLGVRCVASERPWRSFSP